MINIRLLAMAFAGLALRPQVPQIDSAPPKFTAASVKANTSGYNAMGNKFDPGMARWTNYPLNELIGEAYHLKTYQTVGWPEWLGSDKWDVDAKTEGPSTYTQKHLMLQTLLAERFHLIFHYETREVPGYSLVIGKNGSKMHETSEAELVSKRAGITYNRGSILSHGTPMAQWIYFLAAELRCPFEDNTGLKGSYDFKLEWEPNEVRTAGDAERTDPGRPSIFAAVQEQLGLKLEVKRFPVEIFAIDHVGRVPTEN